MIINDYYIPGTMLDTTTSIISDNYNNSTRQLILVILFISILGLLDSLNHARTFPDHFVLSSIAFITILIV